MHSIKNKFGLVLLCVVVVFTSCKERLFPGTLDSGTLNGESWTPDVEHVEIDGIVDFFMLRQNEFLEGEELIIRCVPKEEGTFELGTTPIMNDQCGTNILLSFIGVEGHTFFSAYQLESEPSNPSFITITEVKGKKISGSFEFFLTNIAFNPDTADEFPEEMRVVGDFLSKERK